MGRGECIIDLPEYGVRLRVVVEPIGKPGAVKPTSEERVVRNMVEVARELGYPGTVLGVITALVNNPNAFGAKLVRKRVGLAEWESLVKALGRDVSRYPLSPGDRERADEVDNLLDLLYDLYQQGVSRVILYTKSRVVEGKPRRLFGVEPGPYMDNGVRRRGYSVSLVELVKQFLATQPEVEEG
ncbi:MAG: hypothetical protein RQ842_07980 [Vulcanisaeta sp.]|jgi:hypothetical protein|nr:hypothetical protein [Vulcanisaeta sp.]